MEETILKENVELQDTVSKASMEELLGEAVIENSINEENIREVEDGD